VVYFIFIFIAVRTVWYILFFILWLFELCVIFCFSFYDCSNGVLHFKMQNIYFKTYRWLIITLVSLLRDLQNSNKMKNKIYHTVRTVIKWEKNYTTTRHGNTCIGETLDQLLNGHSNVESIPNISVVQRNGKWFTSDNPPGLPPRTLIDVPPFSAVNLSSFI
jgi:hypothetical protein